MNARLSKSHLPKLLLLHTILSYHYYDVARLVMTRGHLIRPEPNGPFFLLNLATPLLISTYLAYKIVTNLK